MKSVRAGAWTLLLGLGLTSLVFGRVFPGPLHDRCPLGRDLLHPDASVCELSLGGLWVSLALALLAAALATGWGLLMAACAHRLGGVGERAILRGADAFFSLPDVLVLMVLQLAGQMLGDLHPAWRLGPFAWMVISLGLVGWAAPCRVLHNRLRTLSRLERVEAARSLGARPGHVFRYHLWPFLSPVVVQLFLARLPTTVMAESTVSFLGIARLEPMSLGRYLGTSYASILYDGGMRVVGPAWGLLLLVVLGAQLAAPQGERSAAQR